MKLQEVVFIGGSRHREVKQISDLDVLDLSIDIMPAFPFPTLNNPFTERERLERYYLIKKDNMSMPTYTAIEHNLLIWFIVNRIPKDDLISKLDYFKENIDDNVMEKKGFVLMGGSRHGEVKPIPYHYIESGFFDLYIDRKSNEFVDHILTPSVEREKLDRYYVIKHAIFFNRTNKIYLAIEEEALTSLIKLSFENPVRPKQKIFNDVLVLFNELLAEDLTSSIKNESVLHFPKNCSPSDYITKKYQEIQKEIKENPSSAALVASDYVTKNTIEMLKGMLEERGFKKRSLIWESKEKESKDMLLNLYLSNLDNEGKKHMLSNLAEALNLNPRGAQFEHLRKNPKNKGVAHFDSLRRTKQKKEVLT